MSNPTPEQLRAEIDATRANLSNDVDALTDHVTPSNIAHRQTEKVKGKVSDAVSGVKDKVMGTVDDARDKVSSSGGGHDGPGATDRARDAASDARASASAAPGKAASATRGNPLAAGLIALGAGWLLGSLIPVSEKEKELAVTAKDNAGVLAQPIKEKAKEVAENIKPAAQEAAQSVKSSAQDAASTVKDEGRSAAQDVKGSAQDARDEVQRSR